MSADNSQQQYDYIIVGGGSAGCVLANRLSACGTYSVCLVEAGPENKHAGIDIPAGVVSLMDNTNLNWCYETQPEPMLNNRRLYTPRGKVLGGSSSVNAMVYVRGNAQDYDGWRDAGNTGWGYNDVLPYFKKGECYHGGDNAYHSGSGELSVNKQRSPHPLTADFVAAGNAAGYAINDDFNGEVQEGVGYFDVNQRGGKRCSSANAFLEPAMGRPNLTVLTGCAVKRIVFEGKRACGVEFKRDGVMVTARAQREIVLSAGVYGSPQLLMLSGVGDEAHLQAHGIPCVANISGVGKNLQNHIDVVLGNAINNRKSYAVTPLALLKTIPEFFSFIFRKRGMLTSVFSEAGAFIRTDSSLQSPDVQMHFIPMILDDHGRNTSVAKEYGYSLHVCLLTPKSRGEVLLADANSESKPLIKNNFFTESEDVERFAVAVQKAHEITLQEPLCGQFKHAVFPSGGVTDDAGQVMAFAREKAIHLYHGVGTCKMGIGDDAVVDPELKVVGLEGLRVADASIMPTITRGNTHAPTVMIAEKAASMILNVN